MTTFHVREHPNGAVHLHVDFRAGFADQVLGVRADQRDPLARVLSPEPYLTAPELAALFDGEEVVVDHRRSNALAEVVRERLAERPVLPAPTAREVRLGESTDGGVVVEYVRVEWALAEGQDAQAAALALDAAERRAETARQAAADERERERAERERQEAPGKALYETWVQSIEKTAAAGPRWKQWPWWQLTEEQRGQWCRFADVAATAVQDRDGRP